MKILDNAAWFFGILERSRAAEILQRAQALEPGNPHWLERIQALKAQGVGPIGMMDNLELVESMAERKNGFAFLVQATALAFATGQHVKARAYANEVLRQADSVKEKAPREKGRELAERVLRLLAHTAAR